MEKTRTYRYRREISFFFGVGLVFVFLFVSVQPALTANPSDITETPTGTMQPSPTSAALPTLPGTLALTPLYALPGFDLWRFSYSEPGWDTTLAGIIHKPEGEGPYPGVLISHGKGGTAEGFSLVKAQSWFPDYISIAPNYTHAANDIGGIGLPGGSPENVQRAIRCLDILQSQNFVDLIGDSINRDRLYLYGNSMGGFVTIETAAQAGSRVKGAAYTASGLSQSDPELTPSGAAAAETIQAPFLLLHGQMDGTVIPAASQAWADALAYYDKTYQLVWFPDIGHDLNANELTATQAAQFIRDWFSLPAPQITGLSRTAGSPGDQLAVSGLSFGANLNSNSQILFNGQIAVPLSWSETVIQTTVPDQATSGPVRLIVPVGPISDAQVLQPVVGGLRSNNFVFVVISNETPTTTGTPSLTPTETLPPSQTVTATPLPTISPSQTSLPIPTDTPTATLTPSPTITATPQPSMAPSETITPSPTSTSTPSPTPPPTATPLLSPTITTPAPVTLFSDNLDRPDSSTLGSDWVEVETTGALLAIQTNRLCFLDTSDVAIRPIASHAFQPPGAGQLVWQLDFDWKRSGTEKAYRLFMQLGQSALLSDASQDAGVGVNLTWMALNGVHETLAYRRGGVDTSLATLSGPASLVVTADLETHTYQVSVNGAVLGAGIPFDNNVSLDTLRLFTDGLNEVYFTGRCFDNLVITAGGSISPSPTPTDTAAPTQTPSPTASPTPTITPILTSSPTQTIDFTNTPSPSPSPTASLSPSPSPTQTNTITPTSQATATQLPTSTTTSTISPPSKDCNRTSVGFTPVLDMLSGQYYPDPEHSSKIDGGLYGNYQNSLPVDHPHMIKAQEENSQIIPRAADGSADANGKIGMISIGMSNTRTEFLRFIGLANADPAKSSAVVIVNGAQIGQTAEEWAKPEDESWINLETYLSSAGLTASQVQVVWMKLTRTAPQPGADAYPVFVNKFRNDMAAIAQLVKQRYPNVRLIFLSSRVYAGYSLGVLSPEPFAYEGAFSNRLVIEDQINGGGLSGITYENSPVLLWGPYLWADGTTPNSLGIQWDCIDFQDDGVHPSASGSTKVAQGLLDFLKTDSLAVQWFTNNPPPTATPVPTETPSPTLTGTPTDTSTPTSFPTATQSATPTFTPTDSPSPTLTDIPTGTSTPTPIPTTTHTPTPTFTPTNTPSPTVTDTPTESPTPFPTATHTPTPTATSSSEPLDYVARWRFDEGAGTLAYDDSTNGNTLTLTNGATWGSGRSGTALSLDGTNDYAGRSDAELIGAFPAKSTNAAQSFTLSAWVMLDRTGRNQPILTKQGFKIRGFDFYVNAANQVSLEVFSGNFTSTIAASSAKLSASTWTHVAATYDYLSSTGSVIKLYINGSLDTTISNAVGPLRTNTQPLVLGWYSMYNWYLDGLIDDVRVYPRVLSDQEIAELAE